MSTFYDPLGTENLTFTICRELERQPLVPLDPAMEKFPGGGLYAIYYRGNSLDLYAPLCDLDIPVYAGQGSSYTRSGTKAASNNPLWQRVFGNHRRSLSGANILEEFAVRLLLMPDVHADLGENGLRVFYQPVWNSVLDGFGSNEQGPTTRQSKRSKWDTVHAGRRRSYGADDHDLAELTAKATRHIESQVARYYKAPWR